MRYSEKYQVRLENQPVCCSILHLFFGALWEKAFDRLNHYADGFITSLRYEGQEYRIYRVG